MLIPELPQQPNKKVSQGDLGAIAVLGGKHAFRYVRSRHTSDSWKAFVYSVLGFSALLIALETQSISKRVFWGGSATAIMAYAWRAADRWDEANRLDRTIKDVELDDIADELATQNEAKHFQRRMEYGLPNELQELSSLRQQVLQAVAASETAAQGNEQGAIDPATGQVFQEEDLAQTIADSPSDEGNFLFVGKSRSGKTSVILNAMAKKSRRQSVTWKIFNGKPERDNDWGGLIETSCYLPVNSRERAIAMLSAFDQCLRQLQHWQDSQEDHAPLIIVSDEVNNQRALLDKNNTKRVDDISSVFTTQCMSEESGWWISTHSHSVEAVGMDKKFQTSFQIVALGRNGKYETLEAAIDDRYVIRSKAKRDELRRALDSYIQAGGKGSLAFTNQGGVSRIVRLPHYSKDLKIGSRSSHPRSDQSTQRGDRPSESSAVQNLRAQIVETATRDNNDEPATVDVAAPKRRSFIREKLPENAHEFLVYLSEKNEGLFSARTLYQNWGKRRFPEGVDQFKRFLAGLISAGAIAANDAQLAEFRLTISRSELDPE